MAPLLVLSVGGPVLGLIWLIANSKVWFPWLESLGYWTLPVYFLLTIFLVGLCFIPSHASSLVGGLLYGFLQGPALALCAIVGSSYFSFKLIGFIIKERAVNVILKHPLAAKVDNELIRRSGLQAILFIALVRLSPVIPFAGANVLFAASKVKTSYFLLGSLLGLAPRIIIVAVAGAGLAELDFSKGSNIWLGILGGVATLLLIFYMGLVFRKVSKKYYESPGS